MSHSKFSASGATRWLNCTASVDLEAHLPDKESIYATEGTEAHALAEDALFDLKKIEMCQNIDKKYGANLYREYIHAILKRSSGFTLHIEKKLNLDFIDPELFGTADCIIDDFDNETLHIIDYKFGKKRVSPNCEQLRYYAVGYVFQYKPRERLRFKNINLTVVQPRISNPITTYPVSTIELNNFNILLKRTVRDIKRGHTEFKPGSYCWFCKAKEFCIAYKNKYIGNPQSDFEAIN